MIASAPIGIPPRSVRANVLSWLRLALVLAAIGTVYFYRLDRPLLWADEADTGNEARHVLHSGYPTAYDARNVGMYENGAQYSRNLLSRKIPWVQYYVGAASLALFGDDAGGLRALFALIGLLSFFPIRAVLRSRIRHPDILAALVLLAPQVVLLQRNARYYSILIFLNAVLAWIFSDHSGKSRRRLGTSALVFVLLFHTHPFAAACSALSLLLCCALCRRELLGSYALAAGLGLLSWAVWLVALGPPLSRSAEAYSLIASNFRLWCWTFASGLRAVPIDFDAVGCVPTILVMAGLAFASLRGRLVFRQLGRDPLVALILISVLVQGVATAVLLGGETAAQFAVLRYMPHLVVFAELASFIAIASAFGDGLPCVAVCAAAIACNFGGLSYWAKPPSRPVPASWLVPVYSEIFNPPESAWDPLFARLRGNASPSNQDVVAIFPAWSQDMAIFYLGDRCLLPPVLEPPADIPGNAIRRAIGDPATRRLFSRPEWIVDAFGMIKTTPKGYAVAGLFPSNQARPDESARPELTRHGFRQPNAVAGIVLFQRQEPGRQE